MSDFFIYISNPPDLEKRKVYKDNFAVYIQGCNSSFCQRYGPVDVAASRAASRRGRPGSTPGVGTLFLFKSLIYYNTQKHIS